MLPRLVRNVSLSASFVYVLTIVHHIYGAIAFDTPWRYHAAFVGVAGIAATLLLTRFSTSWGPSVLRQTTMAVLAAVTIIVAVGLVGVFEGAYNHAIKLLLFFGGAAPETMHRLFPPPTYEMPSDVLFEVTGVLQFVAGLIAARATVALWRGRRG